MTFKNYLAGTIFLILLIWGPIDHSWSEWLLIRIAYLILIPLIVWLILGWVWNHWQLEEKLDVKLNRIISGTISVGLFVFAIINATSTAHIDNTQTIRTRDGYEDVGDYIALPGPDYGNVFIIVMIAILVLWFGVLKKDSKTSNTK